MAEFQRPSIDADNWYEDNLQRRFIVVAVDEDEGVIELQYFDGEVEEIDLDGWAQLQPQQIAPPEDWSGPFDDLVPDDFGDTERPPHPEDWNGPADEMEMLD